MPFCSNCVSILYRLFKNDRVHLYIYNFFFFLQIIFGLTCFKARKAKTISIFKKYTGKYFWLWLQGVSGACIINKGFTSQWYKIVCEHFYCTNPITSWNKRVTRTTLIYSPKCHTYPVSTWNKRVTSTTTWNKSIFPQYLSKSSNSFHFQCSFVKKIINA